MAINKDDLVEDVKDVDEDIQIEEGTQPTLEDSKEQLRKELLAELEKEKQAEIDRRVTEAIKKRETKLIAEQEEKERLAELSEQERLDEERKKFEIERQQRENVLIEKELQIKLIEMVNEAGLDLKVREMVDLTPFISLQSEEERVSALGERVKTLQSLFDNIVNDRLEDVKKEFLKGKTPENLGADVKTPDKYGDAQKSGDVINMLKQKFSK